MRCASGSRAASGRISSAASTKVLISASSDHVEQQDRVVLGRQRVFDRGPYLLVNVGCDPLLPQLFALEGEIEAIVYARGRLPHNCGTQLEHLHVDVAR